MTRNRKSAKQAGARFERLIADHFKEKVSPVIDRRVKTGAKDKGDIGGVMHMGQRIVIECKDYRGQLKAGTWMNEAHIAMGNDDAGVAIVIAKRQGTTKPGDQWVLTTVDDLISLMNGTPRELP